MTDDKKTKIHKHPTADSKRLNERHEKVLGQDERPRPDKTSQEKEIKTVGQSQPMIKKEESNR